MAKYEIQGSKISQLPKKEQLDGSEAFIIEDAEGTKQADAGALKEFAKYDLSGYATKEELNAKVGGTGVTSIRAVASLPETQEEGVLYIVTGEEA